MTDALLFAASVPVEPTPVQLDGARIATQMTPIATALITILATMLVVALFVATLKVLQLTRLVRAQRALVRRASALTSAAELRKVADEDGVAGARVLYALTERARDRAATSDELRGVALQAITREERRAASLSSVLQGVAATGPLLGLLGTVWGIIEAFLAMDQQASSAITVVAPAMAGALLTTALGLVAAIPSILALQYAERRVAELVNELEAAAQTWIGVLQRHPPSSDDVPSSVVASPASPTQAYTLIPALLEPLP